MIIAIPDKVNHIIGTLTRYGFEAYAVGGCVRDAILGRTPNDWDITTNALPEEVKNLFRRTVDTGIKHGTVSIMIDKERFEVTTYRTDGEYEDFRHPSEVTFTKSLKEDMLRRDFTINAMAYNEKDGLVDFFEGQRDLKKGIIRAVGVPGERFSEDALRILRALRFSAQLGFLIDEETKAAMKDLAPLLVNISAERIQEELIKILLSDRPDILREAYEIGITKEFLPEFDKLMTTTQETPHHMYTVGEHTLHVLKGVPKEKVLRLAALFHDIGKPRLKTIDENGIAHFKKHALEGERITHEILRRLKFDNDTLYRVCKLVLYHDDRIEPKPAVVRRAVSRIGAELFPDLLILQRADTLAQSEYKREEKLNRITEVERIFIDIQRKSECVSIKELAINGKDLLDMGIPQGKQIGAILSELLELVLADPALNTREKLIAIVKKTDI
ncbi:MAG: CCA tRNA nucleotidyltransferase [Lachnospiraceae bacterium]|nr:CCA tRNA nucleotidyltransferase [Lachnospiraceae bacterium]